MTVHQNQGLRKGSMQSKVAKKLMCTSALSPECVLWPCLRDHGGVHHQGMNTSFKVTI